MQIQAAAMSLEGHDFAVVLVGMDLVENHPEANLTIGRLENTFGGAPVILMAQKDDGTPVYYGDTSIVPELGDLPVDQMPWKEYTVR